MINGPGGSAFRIAPSILDADFGHLAEEIQRAEQGGASMIHVDVMDGVFVPNISLGPPVIRAIRKATSLPLDVHLMVDDPRRYLRAFRDAGADWLTIHVEADRHPHRTLSEIHDLGARAGLALNPGTPIEAARELLPGLDLLLIMSVNPGFGGQAFIPGSLDKLVRARQLVTETQAVCEIEVDGGINLDNIASAARAGASILVAGSFVYRGQGTPEANVQSLRDKLSEAFGTEGASPTPPRGPSWR